MMKWGADSLNGYFENYDYQFLNNKNDADWYSTRIRDN